MPWRLSASACRRRRARSASPLPRVAMRCRRGPRLRRHGWDRSEGRRGISRCQRTQGAAGRARGFSYKGELLCIGSINCASRPGWLPDSWWLP
ncbi:hypothetical protein CBM2633_B40083 [Cupriavidus taiwanensis]|nr:hypothetical protein CBM2604_B30084 [Cupriavidus taiwanensis]SOZ32226.1 hypothetical protein CBM2609_B20085 [Cupriavidus taiwanensis]SOZ47824.1 hypothetical protein CBM2610_B20084 [Cupriavidus taiwanensis]SPA21956.1 hypothetical protein CBM2633_B40083 [Cupriavidus taiwanensis]